MSAPSDDVLLARAYLSRVAEPACVPLWAAVRRDGPVATAAAVRTGDVSGELRRVTSARASRYEPEADLDVAARRGVRLVVPESPDWPHIAMAALETTGLARVARWEAGDRRSAPGGELVPPLALWVRGQASLAALSLRSVSVVGARAATPYGDQVAAKLASALAAEEFEVVSGGAYGIDGAAHRGAVAVGGTTVLVTAGGVDRAYPTSHEKLFDAVARSGAIVSESPPGSDPQRHRFLTRNRLIAAFGTGTVVVEAARRSGAMNTAAHCRGLGRTLMAVPGPVSSTMSIGCHMLLAADREPAALVTGAKDVLARIGASSDLPAPDAGPLRPLDRLDATARRVLDGLPAREPISIDRLVVTTGLAVPDVLRSIPSLVEHEVVERCADGQYRLLRPLRSPSAAPS